MQPRKCLIVYFKSPKVLKRLKTYGNLTYYHKKRKYAVLYVDEEKMQETIDKIEKLHHVRKAEASRLDDTAYKPEDFNDLGKMEEQESVSETEDSVSPDPSEEKT
ncbi:MAG: DUF2129 domain-containing protein [Bacillota bacterium]